MPYVVFIAAPEFETLKAMYKAVVDAGITAKLLRVRTKTHPLAPVEPLESLKRLDKIIIIVNTYNLQSSCY